jgi:two-component system, response regulator
MMFTYGETLREVSERSPSQLPTIVLVEDDFDDEQMVHRTLRRAGFHHPLVVERKVELATERIIGLGKASSLALVILDLKLEVASGLEVLGAVRAESATQLAPIVVFSSSYDILDIEASYRAGANGYVHKPVDCLQYQDCLEELLRYWLGLNQSVVWIPGQPRGRW